MRKLEARELSCPFCRTTECERQASLPAQAASLCAFNQRVQPCPSSPAITGEGYSQGSSQIAQHSDILREAQEQDPPGRSPGLSHSLRLGPKALYGDSWRGAEAGQTALPPMATAVFGHEYGGELPAPPHSLAQSLTISEQHRETGTQSPALVSLLFGQSTPRSPHAGASIPPVPGGMDWWTGPAVPTLSMRLASRPLCTL